LTAEGSVGSATTDVARQLGDAIRTVFAVEHITTGLGDGRVISLQGQLLTDSGRAYDRITARFKDYGYTPLLRQQAGHVQIMAVPGVFTSNPSRDYGAILLFGLTVLSVLFAGAAGQAPDVQWALRHLLAGLPFAAGLLGILVAHELGHYFVARRLGVSASLPYFIPMPLSPFGTMGAVIRTRTPMRSRRHLLAIGAAGPVAGLIVGIPALILGLMLSNVQLIPTQQEVFIEGNSLLYAALKYLVFGQFLPSNGYDVFLHPLAFAAWAGLLVTALNLIPAGQLDGGHIAYALLGKSARWLNRLAVVAALVLGTLWSGWFLWATLLLILGQRNAEPLDDVTPLTARQKVFATAMLVLFVLLFTPAPLSILTP
jgi:membrane-associated protease RseP (regulator of RpoE activity)